MYPSWIEQPFSRRLLSAWNPRTAFHPPEALGTSASGQGGVPFHEPTAGYWAGTKRWILSTSLLPASAEGIDFLTAHLFACRSGRHQTVLTPKIRELLCKADIDQGTIDDVPLDTLSELVGLGIVDEQRRHSGSVHMGRRAATEEPTTYVDRVKLTSAGIGLARSIQGVAKVVS
jgi:hypothetical protein